MFDAEPHFAHFGRIDFQAVDGGLDLFDLHFGLDQSFCYFFFSFLVALAIVVVMVKVVLAMVVAMVMMLVVVKVASVADQVT